jgi:hypothetical protein
MGKNLVYLKSNSSVSFKKPLRKRDEKLILQTDATVKKTTVVNFVKSIVITLKEINSLKNDIGFILRELYPMYNSLNIELPFKFGTIFYCWVVVENELFTYDLFYIRKNLTEKEINYVKDKIKITKNIIFVRKPYSEKIDPPFKIELIT